MGPSTTSTTSTDSGAPTSPPPAPPATDPITTSQTPTTPVVTERPSDATEIELGRSVEGRPITAIRRGTSGRIVVLAVGVIHGDEDAGEAIIDELLLAPVPDGIELWLVASMNPDGQASGTRQNANRVDLNRNFPIDWAPLGRPGRWQYAGPAAASEPETQAMLALAEQIRPDLTLWYHQDLFRINPADGRDGEIRQRYAELTGLPIIPVTGGTYTGTASQWSRTIADEGGIGFTVELGPSLDAAGARRHADAVLAIAAAL